MTCVNALSEWLTAEVRRDGGVYFQEYARGVPVTGVERRGITKTRGTRITFKPDPEIFADEKLTYDTILAARARAGVPQQRRAADGGGRADGPARGPSATRAGCARSSSTSTATSRSSIPRSSTSRARKGRTPSRSPCSTTTATRETVLSFANTVNTHEGGTHLSGFRAALTRTFNQYGKSLGALKEGEQLTGEDYREGLTAVISLKLPDPQFEGQTKTQARQPRGAGHRRADDQRAARHLLRGEPDRRPRRSARRPARPRGRARPPARPANSSAARARSPAPTCPASSPTAPAATRETTELFLVEGISAGGTAKQGRDRTFQAILPLRGVVINVEKTTLDKVLANEEIRTLVSALGTGIGAEEFDLAKLRYNKRDHHDRRRRGRRAHPHAAPDFLLPADGGVD